MIRSNCNSAAAVNKTLYYSAFIILKLIFKKWVGGLDWIDLVQDKDG
jgi:hypothetical protein